jgi:hypothetical protein
MPIIPGNGIWGNPVLECKVVCTKREKSGIMEWEIKEEDGRYSLANVPG